MERLTKRTAAGTPNLNYTKQCYYDNGDKDQVAVSAFRQRAIDRLAHYEDLEEQGRLVELPAKISARVWLTEWWKKSSAWGKLSALIEMRIVYFSIEADGIYAHFEVGSLNTKYFGKVAFLSMEEAEAALAASGKEG